MAAVPTDACISCSEVRGVITGLKGQLALGKQTEASPSLPVGNFGLSYRVDAWETHCKSSLGVQLLLEVCQGLSQGSLKALRPCSECEPAPDILGSDLLHQGFSSLGAH